MFSHEDMRICPRLIRRSYNIVSTSSKLVQQKWSIFAPKRNKVVTKEVEKTLEADFIREVFYLD